MKNTTIQAFRVPNDLMRWLKEGLQNSGGKGGPLWWIQRTAVFGGNSMAIAAEKQQSDAPPELIRGTPWVLQTFLHFAI